MKELLMTPGPTFVTDRVRQAMSKPIINPDIDPAFYEFYNNVTIKLQKILHTENETLVLDGEGILGLEAACASLIEPGDKVLVLANGIFGEGFGDFVKMYGGVPTYLKKDFRDPITAEDLTAFLKDDSDFKLATLVHCETPSGLINPIETLCPVLHEHGIISVVDAVSSIAGMEVKTDEWKIDMILGGSQKCLSAPPGLTFLTISPRAKSAMENRQVPITGFYANLLIWDGWYEKKWFPYTQPISDLYGFSEALDVYLEDGAAIERHAAIAKEVRKRLIELGLKLYPNNGYSNSVTAFEVPDGYTSQSFLEGIRDQYGLVLTGAFGSLSGKVIRIGHMGENCREDKVHLTLDAIEQMIHIK